MLISLLILMAMPLGQGEGESAIPLQPRPLSKMLSGGIWAREQGVISPSVQLYSGGLKPPRRVAGNFSRSVVVSRDLGKNPYQNYVSLAVNPKDGSNLILVTLDYQYSLAEAYVSRDGGFRWEGPKVLKIMREDYFGSDPTVAFSRDGSAYACYMSIGYMSFLVQGNLYEAMVSSIVVSRSDDGGESWSSPYVASSGDVVVLEDRVIVKFLDKPWLTVGPDPEDPKEDVLYVTYTEFLYEYPISSEYPYLRTPTIKTTIKLVSSRDGGRNWSEPVSVSPTHLYIYGLSKRIVQGSMPAVAPDGKLYVGYYDSLADGPWEGKFAPTVVWSTDGGRSFSEPVKVAEMDEMDYWLRPTMFRAWTSMMAYLAVGPNGYVYYVFAAKGEGPDPADIYFCRSTDGKDWSKPKKLNDDETERGQFFPFVVVDKDGVVHVAWGDMRDDPSDTSYNIYYTKSEDCGDTFSPNMRVSDHPSNPMQGMPEFIGDYFGMAVGEDVYIAWVDCRYGPNGRANEDVVLARGEEFPEPRIEVSPKEGPSGSTVTVTGYGFSYDREVYLSVDGVQVSTAIVDLNGSFKVGIRLPFLAEGRHVISAEDETGNLAEADFYATRNLTPIGEELVRLEGELNETKSMLGKVLDLNQSYGSVQALLNESNERIDRLEGSLNSLYYGIVGIGVLSVAAITLSLISLRKRR